MSPYTNYSRAELERFAFDTRRRIATHAQNITQSEARTREEEARLKIIVDEIDRRDAISQSSDPSKSASPYDLAAAYKTLSEYDLNNVWAASTNERARRVREGQEKLVYVKAEPRNAAHTHWWNGRYETLFPSLALGVTDPTEAIKYFRSYYPFAKITITPVKPA